MHEWYYQIGSDVVGPVSLDELKRAVADGTISADTLVRQGEAGEWVPAGQVAELSSVLVGPTGATGVAPCPDCRAMVSKRAASCPKCGCPGPHVADLPWRLIDAQLKDYVFVRVVAWIWAAVGVVMLVAAAVLALMALAEPTMMVLVLALLVNGLILLGLAQLVVLFIDVAKNTETIMRLVCQLLGRARLSAEWPRQAWLRKLIVEALQR